jgi:hypothetical protein
MGAWGKLPWDNDGAADWFDSLFSKSKLAKVVEETLKLDAEGSYEEIRAAASVLIFLGRPYIWPVSDLSRQLIRAADRLEEISHLEVVTESRELVEEINAEIAELRSRVKPPGAAHLRQSVPKNWWQFWK